MNSNRNKKLNSVKASAIDIHNQLDLKEGQSIDLLKELHILTKDGKINQDSRRKLKQIYHFYNFIEPLLIDIEKQLQNNSDKSDFFLVDHGAGKSYLGFILYDLFFKNKFFNHTVYGVEIRSDLVLKSKQLAEKLNFINMKFVHGHVHETIHSKDLPSKVDVVTALHACDSATDDAIDFALAKNAQKIVLVPCCQAEVARILNENKKYLHGQAILELFRYPIHTREFGSHLTNVLRVLRLAAAGYDVQVTELIGLEHSMKNELIIASKNNNPDKKSYFNQCQQKLTEIIKVFRLEDLENRFSRLTIE